MNGSIADKFLSSIDPDDPDYQRQLMRPAEIKEDVKLMEQRKRVSLILNSEAFREELEQIVDSQLRSGPQPVSLLALQQIADALQLPQATTATNTLSAARTYGGPAPGTPLPINDIRGVGSLSYTKGERLLRCKLASVCRLLDLFGWAAPIPGGVALSARLPSDYERAPPTFLATPYGLLLHEVTASSLVKLDARGVALGSGTTPFGPAAVWKSLDGPLYEARPALRCVLQLRTPATIAVSAARNGLVPLTVEAVACGSVALVETSEAAALAKSNVILIRNIGLVCCGESVEEAFYYAQRAVQACEAQLAAAALGVDHFYTLENFQCEAVRATLDAQLDVLPKANATSLSTSQSLRADGTEPSNWSLNELEFEAFMRYLDNAGFRTGYPYRIPVIKHGHAHKAQSEIAEVELPPTASSLADELQQFDLAHGSGRATQLLKEVSAAKKSATLPAGGFRAEQRARVTATPQATLPRDLSEQRDIKQLQPAKPAESVQPTLLTPDYPQIVAVEASPARASVPVPTPAVALTSSTPTSPVRGEIESERSRTIPLATENALARASLQINVNTPVGSLNASASANRPRSVDQSKADYISAAGAAKIEISVESSTSRDAAADEEDGVGKKDKKKEKSGIFASFSKKKEKAK